MAQVFVIAAISSRDVTATYLYCILKAATKPSTARCPEGLPGAERPHVAPVGGSLWLVVARVPLLTYGPEHLERRLSDMDWVGSVALAHESVVEHFARRAGATVIPMKLFTMFSSMDRAVSDVAERRGSITATMRRIAGAEEWGVRVLRDPAVPIARADANRASSGAAFLAAKKRAKDDATSSRLAAAEAAADVFGQLVKIARDARRRSDAPAAGVTPPLLDGAFLVPVASRGPFKKAATAAAARCAAAGARMTLSGPWPAYNFVQEEEER